MVQRFRVALKGMLARGVDPHVRRWEETHHRTVSEVLKSRSPRRRYTAGREAKILTLLRKFAPAQLLDRGVRKQFGLEAV
jgi:hypothetical protein